MQWSMLCHAAALVGIAQRVLHPFPDQSRLSHEADVLVEFFDVWTTLLKEDQDECMCLEICREITNRKYHAEAPCYKRMRGIIVALSSVSDVI